MNKSAPFAYRRVPVRLLKALPIRENPRLHVLDYRLTLAPGMLVSHYAPRATMRLAAEALRPGEVGLDFGSRFAGPGGTVLDLSPRRDLAEAAANLFGFLRRLDDALEGAGVIAVAPIPEEGLGEAIADRLARAAAER